MSDLVHKAKKEHPDAYVNPIGAGTETLTHLREALRTRGVKLTDLSKQLDIPYRSLQNYFKRQDIPLSLYEKICVTADIPFEYPRHGGRIKLEHSTLASAIIDVFGELLPTFCFEEAPTIDKMVLFSSTSPARSTTDLRRDAAALAVLIEGAYDRHVERRITSKDREHD